MANTANGFPRPGYSRAARSYQSGMTFKMHEIDTSPRVSQRPTIDLGPVLEGEILPPSKSLVRYDTGIRASSIVPKISASLTRLMIDRGVPLSFIEGVIRFHPYIRAAATAFDVARIAFALAQEAGWLDNLWGTSQLLPEPWHPMGVSTIVTDCTGSRTGTVSYNGGGCGYGSWNETLFGAVTEGTYSDTGSYMPPIPGATGKFWKYQYVRNQSRSVNFLGQTVWVGEQEQYWDVRIDQYSPSLGEPNTAPVTMAIPSGAPFTRPFRELVNDPWTEPSSKPVTATGGGPTFIFTPNGTTVKPPEWRPRQPPKKGEKEKKYVLSLRTLGPGAVLTGHIFGILTEWSDLVDAFYDATGTKPGRVIHFKGTSRVKVVKKKLDIYDKMNWVADHADDIDWNQVVANLVGNAIQDNIQGRMAKQVAKGIGKATGRPVSITWGPSL